MHSKETIQALYSALKVTWEQHRKNWLEVSKFVGIELDTDYMQTTGKAAQTASQDKDFFVDDPTAAISVNQAGDYLLGIMWGTGDKTFDLVPSRYAKEKATVQEMEDYFRFCTDQALHHMNHPSAGLSTAMRPYAYDQFSFGTSGIGCFINNAFRDRTEENALVFSNYGVDNTLIDEGKGGQPDIVFTVYNWKINRIIGEFGLEGLPKILVDAYNSKDFNKDFKLVFGFYPREDYDPKVKGKRGTRYRGVWFLDGYEDKSIFKEEDFKDRPIAMARAIKLRGDSYGRSAGTLILSTIRSVNFMVGNAIETVDKMGRPPLGMFNSALFGDSIFDTSADGLTIFNQAFSTGGNPVFPIHDIGDPSAILQFIVPYLNEKITTAFKVDALLDFSSAKEMTATESLQRYAIRGKSLSGFLIQQKNELLVPLVKRSVNVLYNLGEMGVDARNNPDVIKKFIRTGNAGRIIPQAILDCIDEGRPWFEIKFNNELEKLTRTEAVQNLVQILQAITGISAVYPQIIDAVDWYKLIAEINSNLDQNSQLLIGEDNFKKMIEAQAQAQQQMMQLQAGQAMAQVGKDAASANKQNSEAMNVSR